MFKVTISNAKKIKELTISEKFLDLKQKPIW